jgi:hypothetical protein
MRFAILAMGFLVLAIGLLVGTSVRAMAQDPIRCTPYRIDWNNGLNQSLDQAALRALRLRITGQGLSEVCDVLLAEINRQLERAEAAARPTPAPSRNPPPPTTAEEQGFARAQQVNTCDAWRGFTTLFGESGTLGRRAVQARDSACASPPAPPPSVRVIEPEMVRIPGHNFEAGRFEVTFAEWDACVADGGCNGYSPPDEGWGRGRRPVINVSWNDAQTYVQWLSQRTGRRYRLLTEAEWEIAARAGTTTEYSWGYDPPVCDQSARNGANFSDCNDDRTRPVGSFRPNGFGLYDVHGNVWEWVQDADGSWRVRRGGSRGDYPNGLRSANSLWSSSTLRSGSLGFRLARELEG